MERCKKNSRTIADDILEKVEEENKMAENGKVMLESFKELVTVIDKFKNQVIPMDKFLQEMQWTKDNVGSQVSKLMTEYNDLKATNESIRNENNLLLFERQDKEKKVIEEARKNLIDVSVEKSKLMAENEQLKKEIYANQKRLEEMVGKVKEMNSIKGK